MAAPNARVAAELHRVGRHLRLAWPVFVAFAVQRLLTIAFVNRGDWLSRMTVRWDAGWYLGISKGGYVYPNVTADGLIKASNLAYFPLYPWLTRAVSGVGAISDNAAMLIVSWLGGLVAVWAIFEVGNALYGRWTGIALAAVWGMAPASLALTMGYPEGLFTAAAAAALFCLIRHRPVWAGGCAIVAGLLRPSAIAVIAMIAAYALVEVIRWRRARTAPGPSSVPGADVPVVELPVIRALLGLALSTLGLATYLIYVAIRTGNLFGYVAVQAQWGQQTAAPASYWEGTWDGLVDPPRALVPATIAVCLGYLLLFCLIVFQRRLVWASVYAGVLLVMTLSHVTFQWVYARQLLPAFVLLIPLVRMRVPRAGAIAAIALGSIAMAWGSAQFLLETSAGM